jgi:hypothetical protein
VSSKFILQCRDSLQKLAFYNIVQLVEVSGHCGIHENEEADALETGSSSAFVGPELCLRSGSAYLNYPEPHGA